MAKGGDTIVIAIRLYESMHVACFITDDTDLFSLFVYC